MTEPNNCEICFVCYTLTEDGDGDLSGGGGCSHRFCGACLEGVSKTDFLYCPLCKTDWTAYFYEKYPNNMRVHSEEESSDEDDDSESESSSSESDDDSDSSSSSSSSSSETSIKSFG